MLFRSSAALQGRDPLKGALLGGALGGIGAGLAGSLGGAAGTEAIAAQAGQEAATAFAPQVAGIDYSGMIPVETGFYDPSTMSNIAAPASTPQTLAMNRIAAMPNISPAMQTSFQEGLAAGADPTKMVESAAATNRVLAGPQTFGEKAANFISQRPVMAGTALAGLAAMPSPKPFSPPGAATYEGPLSRFTYDPRTYTPYTPTPPMPPYRAQYAKEGGIINLANGGIPTGPVERLGQQVVGAGGLYPQSQMDKTYFATPTQMPTSAEVVSADYDARTNPYTGAMMAKGGYASLGDIDDLISEARSTSGGMAALQSKARGDDPNALAALAKIQQREMLEKHSRLAGGGIAALREGSFVVPADVVSHLGNGSTDAGIAALRTKTGAKPIRGGGDGMSDSISTSIEGRQKARVADGEAVIEPEQVRKLGKGSAKKGADRLYAMMDNVRKARTGSTKQGRQINPAQIGRAHV